MREPQTYTTWKITCGSPADCDALRGWLSNRIDLDRVVMQSVRTVPGGVEREELIPHRLGDYFAAIRLLPDAQASPPSFSLEFERLANSGRYWKDLMVGIVQELQAASQRPSIELESKRHRDIVQVNL